MKTTKNELSMYLGGLVEQLFMISFFVGYTSFWLNLKNVNSGETF